MRERGVNLSWHAAALVAVLPLLMAATCGGDDEPEYVSAFCVNNPGQMCALDSNCDDGEFCNGVERCMPGAGDADACGCRPAVNPCAANQTCNEVFARCEMCLTDDDGDGHVSMACGGDDCDDADMNRFPGNSEVCDAPGHDEDCNVETYGSRDRDGDQFDDGACCNYDSGGAGRCGADCDDANAALVPGAQRCQKTASSSVEICEGGQWSAPVACLNQGTCVIQPNGLGVCQ